MNEESNLAQKLKIDVSFEIVGGLVSDRFVQVSHLELLRLTAVLVYFRFVVSLVDCPHSIVNILSNEKYLY